ncbi:MAG: mammalian cell entry protein [Mycobacteriaceae bacterium]|nr:mammalian cell entry protein [Mycobacteriaceae bacterium]
MPDEQLAVAAAEITVAAAPESGEPKTGATTPRRLRPPPPRLAPIVGLVLVLTLVGLSGWLGFKAYQLREAQHVRALLVQVGKQGAVNLTTIDYRNAEADVQRILDSSTGQFREEFAQRSEPFVEVVKKAQSTSSGTVTEAGLESVSGQEGRVLVAVTVKTVNRGVPDEQSRYWRMRMTVIKEGDGAKVAKVDFVP